MNLNTIRSIRISIFIVAICLSSCITLTASESEQSTIHFSSYTQLQSFKEFAKDFVDNGISSLSSFKTYSENKLVTIDFDKGDYIKESPSEAFRYLKYYFKIKKYKIKKNKIDFTDGELTVTLFFRKNSDGEWKLYKYDGVA